MPATYGLLCFFAVSMDAGPNFTCPDCKQTFSPSQWSNIKSMLGPTRPDVNLKVLFRCPNCNANIELFVAFHYFSVDRVALCIQKSVEEGASGIQTNWWNEL